jgi:hypothetical protein
MKNKFIPILLFVTCLITHTGTSFAQESFFKLSSEQIHDLEIEEINPGTYEITTTGTDPYLFTDPLGSALEEGNTVLTFNYFSPEYLDHFQVFFGPPITENKSISDELGVREGWTSHAVDLGPELNDWGKTGDILRFDFGAKAGYKIQLKDIRFRKPNSQELARIASREKIKKEEALRKAALKNYLNKEFSIGLNEVLVKEDSVFITGTAPGETRDLYIAEVPLHQDIAWSPTFDNIYLIPKNKGIFHLAVPRYLITGDHKTDRLLSKWLVVEKNQDGFTLRSHARYADKIQPIHHLPKEQLSGKKGIGGFHANQFTSDLDSLGITSVTVNMWISKMMRSKPSANTISFTYGDKTYYADRKWLERHDRTLQETVRRNIIVSSIILIDKAVNTPDKIIGDILQHPDCDPAGIYSMANMTTPEGVEYYAAAMDFLARRYSRPDKKYGRIHNWIIHNEVDAGWVWTNMGEKDSLLFMDTYHKSMRLVHNIARNYNPHAKAFISLTHYWNWTQDKHFYHSKDLLGILLKYSAVEGDFDWGIAHHPYPESLFEPKSWEDKKVDFTFDTPLITFKNIEVLDAWVKQPFTMYLGKHKRTVFLSEQGPNSKDYSSINLKEQAASMAYVWKKMEVLSGIDAFQFHNWIDNRGEGGLRIGLRRFPDDEEDPAGKKPVWYVYRDLGTPDEHGAIEFAKEIIGITDWDQVQYQKEIK